MVKETLMRYIITILCIGILNMLIYLNFEQGRQSLHIGAGICIAIFLIKMIVSSFKKYNKDKVKEWF